MPPPPPPGRVLSLHSSGVLGETRGNLHGVYGCGNGTHEELAGSRDRLLNVIDDEGRAGGGELESFHCCVVLSYRESTGLGGDGGDG
jgi:hypothetical protein